MSNHCRGEKCLTCKTDLIATLSESQKYYASWLASPETGEADISIKHFSEHGVDSFFPRCFVITRIGQ
jgi:hypothetical protein